MKMHIEQIAWIWDCSFTFRLLKGELTWRVVEKAADRALIVARSLGLKLWVLQYYI